MTDWHFVFFFSFLLLGHCLLVPVRVSTCVVMCWPVLYWLVAVGIGAVQIPGARIFGICQRVCAPTLQSRRADLGLHDSLCDALRARSTQSQSSSRDSPPTADALCTQSLFSKTKLTKALPRHPAANYVFLSRLAKKPRCLKCTHCTRCCTVFVL